MYIQIVLNANVGAYTYTYIFYKQICIRERERAREREREKKRARARERASERGKGGRGSLRVAAGPKACFEGDFLVKVYLKCVGSLEVPKAPCTFIVDT